MRRRGKGAGSMKERCFLNWIGTLGFENEVSISVDFENEVSISVDFENEVSISVEFENEVSISVEPIGGDGSTAMERRPTRVLPPVGDVSLLSLMAGCGSASP